MKKSEAEDVHAAMTEGQVASVADDKAAEEARRAAYRAEDQAWVDAARDGDRRAFGRLVERYQERVYAIAYGILQNRDDAWDAAQEAFVKAYQNLHRFEGGASFYTWLYRITHNLAIDHYRAKRRRRQVDFEDKPGVNAAMAAKQPLSVTADPGQTLGRRELHEVLNQAMEALSNNHRAIIVLREIEGLSYEELADVLEISKGTVMSRLFHARKNLQSLLGPYVEHGAQVPASLKLAKQEA